MYTFLETHRLRTGESLVVARVQGPAAEWADRIEPFLSHKGDPWNWQVARTLRDEVAPLEPNYYLGVVDGEIAGSICTFEYRGVGILGHVYTAPAFRRRGVCRSIMKTQMADFRARAGLALILGTGFDSAAYHIYASFGFRSVAPQSGMMEYYTTDIDDYERRHFAASPSTVRASDWRDWPGFTGLTSQRAGSPVRSVLLSVYGRESMEGPYLGLRRRADRSADSRIFSLEADATGAIVGMATALPDPRFPGIVICDLFVHPTWADRSVELASHIVDSDAPLHAYAEIGDEPRISAFESHGFAVSHRMPHPISVDGRSVDMLLMSRGERPSRMR